MKKSFYFFWFNVFFYSLFSLDGVHANIDDYTKLTYQYTCEKNVGTLETKLLYRDSVVMVKKFTINHAGYIRSLEQDSDDDWFWTFGVKETDNMFIPGCGCPDALSGSTQNYTASITTDGTGKTVRDDYLFTIGTGSMLEGMKIANTIILTPTAGGGIPPTCDNFCKEKEREKCPNVCFGSGSKIPACTLSVLETSLPLGSGAYQLPLHGSHQYCEVLASPTVTCENLTGSSISIDSLGSSRAIILLPAQVMSRTGSCTITYPKTVCDTGRTQTIWIGSGTQGGRGPNVTTPAGGTTSPIGANTTTNPTGTISDRCSAYLEVSDAGSWSREAVYYDTLQTYRVHTGASCASGTLTFEANTLSPIGGSFTGTLPTNLSSSGTFQAKIIRTGSATLITPRGLSVNISFTPQTGTKYNVTEKVSDPQGTPLSIIGKYVKGFRVIGNIVGVNGNQYNMNSGSILVDTSIFNRIQSSMQQSVTLLTRNMSSGTIVNRVLFMEGSNIVYSKLDKSFSTLIVRGNLTLDENISSLRGIIVLKDANGNNGNIIIGDTVTNIRALIFSEGIIRGTSTSADTLNPDLQLVIHGSLYSRNTVGGSADPNNLFLFNNSPTNDKDLAFMTDLNNLRSGNGGKTYLDRYSDSSILEFDQSALQNPPPGFSF